VHTEHAVHSDRAAELSCWGPSIHIAMFHAGAQLLQHPASELAIAKQVLRSDSFCRPHRLNIYHHSTKSIIDNVMACSVGRAQSRHMRRSEKEIKTDIFVSLDFCTLASFIRSDGSSAGAISGLNRIVASVVGGQLTVNCG